MNNYTELAVLDEVLDYLNGNKDDIAVHEGVLGILAGVAAILLAPYIIILPIACLLSLASKSAAKVDKEVFDEFIRTYPNAMNEISKASDLFYDKILKKVMGKNIKYFKKKNIVKKDDIFVKNGRLYVCFVDFDGEALCKDIMGTDNYGKICDMVHWGDSDSNPYSSYAKKRLNDPENYGLDNLTDQEINTAKENCNKLAKLENTLDEILRNYRNLNKSVKDAIKGVEIRFEYSTKYEDYWLDDLLDYNNDCYFDYSIPIKDYSKMELPDNLSSAIKAKVNKMQK